MSPRSSPFRVLFFLVILAQNIWGHEVNQLFGELDTRGDPPREWVATIYFDAAYALPEFRDDPDVPAPGRQWLIDLPPEEHQRVQQGAKRFLHDTLIIFSDGRPVEVNYTFPDYATSPPEFVTRRIDRAIVRVEIQAGAELLTRGVILEVSPTCPLTYLFQTGENTFLPLAPGSSHSYRPFAIGQKLPAEPAGGTSLFWLGFRHVLPLGFDHTLFLLALFFHRRNLRSLVLHSLVFTLAHSLSLIGILLWRIELPWPTAVEAAIAATIVATAASNLVPRWQNSDSRWTSLVVFLMGLIHGLGFGSVLRDQLLGSGTTGVILANAGIEFAQICILAGAWIATLGWHQTHAYRVTRVAASLIIAAIGTFWIIERTRPF